MFLNPEHFELIAGEDAVAALRVARAALKPGDDTLCRQQEREAREGYVGVEVVQTNYGFSVRYASGLQNFAIVARRIPDLDAAKAVATEWVFRDPSRRYAYVRTMISMQNAVLA
jgi:hypothetical protein